MSIKAIGMGMELAHFVNENGRITDARNMEEWESEIVFEAQEREYDEELIQEIGEWVRNEFVPN